MLNINIVDESKADDLFIAADEAENIKEFWLPIEWSVKAKLPVKAKNLQESAEWVQENIGQFPINQDVYLDIPDYINGGLS